MGMYEMGWTDPYGPSDYPNQPTSFAKWPTCPHELSSPIEQIRWPKGDDDQDSLNAPGIYEIKITYYA